VSHSTNYMEVINRPNVSLLQQSIAYLRADKRKWICLSLVLIIPLVYNSWRFFPEDITVSYYEDFSIFWWTLSVNFISLLIAAGWMLTIPRKDYVMRFVLSALLIYGIYMTYAILPVADETPLYIDLLAVAVVFVVVYGSIVYVQRNYLEKKPSYESMHINLLHDLNHHRFMGAVCRIEGMLKVSDMEDHYRDACEKEIEELKETFAYISDKYENLR